MSGQLLTPKEVAERARLHYRVVLKAIGDGELEAIKLRGRLRIRESAYERWLEQSTVDPNPDLAPIRPRRRPAPAPVGTFRAKLRAAGEGGAR